MYFTSFSSWKSLFWVSQKHTRLRLGNNCIEDLVILRSMKLLRVYIKRRLVPMPMKLAEIHILWVTSCEIITSAFFMLHKNAGCVTFSFQMHLFAFLFFFFPFFHVCTLIALEIPTIEAELGLPLVSFCTGAEHLFWYKQWDALNIWMVCLLLQK